MTKKTKLAKVHRDIIEEYGNKHIIGTISRTSEATLFQQLVDEANATIRVKYPEADMVILRKYGLTRTDFCLRFQFPSGRVDGFSFYARTDIADLPCRNGCYNNDVFPVVESFELAFDEHAKQKLENDKQEAEKLSQFRAFLAACKTVEDVLEVIDLPEAIRERLGHRSSALVAVTAETVATLKEAFKHAA